MSLVVDMEKLNYQHPAPLPKILRIPSILADRLSHFEVIIDVGDETGLPDDFTQDEIISGMWWRHLVSGACGGALSRTLTAPLDRVKVMLMVYGSKHREMGILSTFQHMLKDGGVKSFWRGNGINVMKIAPESALKFAFYEKMKLLIKGDRTEDLVIYERFCAGAIAGALSQTVIYPMEVIKTRMALRRTGQYTSAFDCAFKIYKGEGIRNFYRGYAVNLMGILPYAGIDLAFYETMKKLHSERYNIEKPNPLIIVSCGVVSSTLGQFCCYPLSLIRTKLQAQVSYGPRDNFVTLGKWIYQNEGMKGLYRGLIPNMMKCIPSVCINYLGYEYIRNYFNLQMT